MKTLHRIFVLGLFILSTSHLLAQKIERKPPQPRRAVIKLKFINYENIPNTLTIVLNTDPLKFGMSTDKEYTAIRDTSDLFTFNLPILKAPARIYIQNKAFDLSINGIYWIEPNDHVLLKINCTEKNILFTAFGNGSAKYKYKQYRDSLFYSNAKVIISQPKTIEYLNKDLDYTNTYYNQQLEILNHFKPSINSFMFKILKAEIIGKTIQSKWTTITAFYRRTAPNDIIFINRALALEKENLIWNVETDIAIHSSDYIYGKKIAAIGYIAAKYNGIYSRIIQTYNYLKSEYSGKLREYLITSYLTNRPEGDANDLNHALSDAMVLVKNKELLTRLKQFRNALTFSTTDYQYTFVDTLGNKRSLSEWKGKVILIDFWFKGCRHCINYAKDFEEKILPEFINNENIAFIGMNTDIDKSLWMKGIQSREYTSNKTINLNTLGNGFEHPFPKMFNVIGAPYLFLIGKDGRLITANLSTTNTNKIVEQIKKAIEK